jgi:hypothetical protein
MRGVNALFAYPAHLSITSHKTSQLSGKKENSTIIIPNGAVSFPLAPFLSPAAGPLPGLTGGCGGGLAAGGQCGGAGAGRPGVTAAARPPALLGALYPDLNSRLAEVRRLSCCNDDFRQAFRPRCAGLREAGRGWRPGPAVPVGGKPFTPGILAAGRERPASAGKHPGVPGPGVVAGFNARGGPWRDGAPCRAVVVDRQPPCLTAAAVTRWRGNAVARAPTGSLPGRVRPFRQEDVMEDV